MNSFELNQHHQRIEAVIARAQEASGDNIEMLSHWAKYACVLSAGFLEIALRDVYARFAKGSSSDAVHSFVVTRLNRIRNPKCRAFLEVARAFRPGWEDELATFLNGRGRREAIDSIMNERHLIAHGRNSDITINRVRTYLARAVEVVAFIEDQCGL